MNKLLIEVYVPSISRSFDVFIPRNARAFELLQLLTVAVAKLSDDLFIPNNAALCNGRTGLIYANNMSVNDMKLQNGSRLMLI